MSESDKTSPTPAESRERWKERGYDADMIRYTAAEAISIAKLWRAGKMIGGDEEGVRAALLDEVERLMAPTQEPAI